MPLFDYKCDQCGAEKRNELVKNHSDEVLCDSCNTPMIKFFPKSSFYLKGRGWAPDSYIKPKETPPTPTKSD